MREWIDSLWEWERVSERPFCSFAEFNDEGDEKRCWIKDPSFELCLLCLLAEISQMLGAINYHLEGIKKGEQY